VQESRSESSVVL